MSKLNLKRPQSKLERLWQKLNQDDMPKTLQKGKYTLIFCFTFCQVIGFLIFYVATHINSWIMAFQQINGIDNQGNDIIVYSLHNFQEFFKLLGRDDSGLYIGLRNTALYFTLNTFVLLPVPFFFAYFFHKKLTGYRFFRLALYLPSIISSVAIVSMIKYILAGNGPIDAIMSNFGMKYEPLLRNNDTATPTILTYCFWAGLSGNLLLFQGAFNRVPSSVIDAAQIDGVSDRQELFFIYIPMVMPTISTIVILNVTNIFNISGPILLFTGGAYETTTINYWIYDQVKIQSSYNLPSAVGIMFTLINLPLIVCVRALFKRFDDIKY